MRILAALILAAVAATIAEHAHGAPLAAPPASPAPARGLASAPKTSRKPAPGELEEIVRTTAPTSATKLPKGARVKAVRPTTSLEIPLAPSRVTIDISAAPRRAGAVTTNAVLTFWKEEDVAARMPIAIDLDVPASALVSDVTKGSTVVLVVRRGLVEITTSAVTSADADVGDVVQVLLRPSGRAMRAQVIAKDRAVAMEDGR